MSMYHMQICTFVYTCGLYFSCLCDSVTFFRVSPFVGVHLQNDKPVLSPPHSHHLSSVCSGLVFQTQATITAGMTGQCSPLPVPSISVLNSQRWCYRHRPPCQTVYMKAGYPNLGSCACIQVPYLFESHFSSIKFILSDQSYYQLSLYLSLLSVWIRKKNLSFHCNHIL